MKNYLFPLLCCLALASCKNDLELPSLEMSEPASSNHLMEAEVVDQSQWVSGSGILIDEDIYTLEEVGEDIFLVQRSAENFQFEKKLLLFENKGGRIPFMCLLFAQ
ncbi:MAG: hypothetical protein IPJ00_19385 [Saprospirales bacterium]|nr:hypothetical protein [Saprospirales bacterium]